MKSYKDKVIEVLKHNAYYDDFGDLNISEQDYSKIAKAVSDIRDRRIEELERLLGIAKEEIIKKIKKNIVY